MTEKLISFGSFEFPILDGFEYLVNEEVAETDFLFVNDPHESFSMYFEKGFPIFTVPQKAERDYCLFEIRKPNRVIKFFCPEKRENLDTAVWYFYVEISDDAGVTHSLPGQVRVEFEGDALRQSKSKPKFIEVLEQVRLRAVASA